MMTWRGHKTRANLTVQLADCQFLTEEDESRVKNFFGVERVYAEYSNREVAQVWLAYRPPLTRKVRTLVSVHYGDIMDDGASEDAALLVAREILGVRDPKIELTRKDNGETWLVGMCSLDDFARNL